MAPIDIITCCSFVVCLCMGFVSHWWHHQTSSCYPFPKITMLSHMTVRSLNCSHPLVSVSVCYSEHKGYVFCSCRSIFAPCVMKVVSKWRSQCFPIRLAVCHSAIYRILLPWTIWILVLLAGIAYCRCECILVIPSDILLRFPSMLSLAHWLKNGKWQLLPSDLPRDGAIAVSEQLV